ncbi:MAG: DUF116 domain-containing protein [Syntrophomonadaceae bacterium]|nr:DUF116 domain-containing protein [Syntrophomonadaceae bacterium]
MEIKKRIYVGLLMVSMLLALTLAGGVWFLLQNRELLVGRVLLTVIASIVGIIFLLAGIGVLAIILMIMKSKSIPSLDSLTRMANELLFPITLLTGRLAGINKEKILQSYIAVNNYLVKSKKLLLDGRQVLILLPHCIQDSKCPHKITMDINNCKRCQKCCVSDLIDLGERYHAMVKVATGGTLARKFIEQTKPRGVVAVACERDLSLGIQDATHIPVIGVLNCRPNGPCINTSVVVTDVENALQAICKGG